MALGVAILRADAAFADMGRRAAARLIAPQVAAGRRVWFMGHWGFQWYAQEAGAIPLTLTAPYPQPGDMVAVSRYCTAGVDMSRLLSSLQFVFVEGMRDDSPGGRTMREGAGFYSNVFGFLPWTWGTGTLEEITLVEVVASRVH